MDVYFNFTNPSDNWIQTLSAIAAPVAAFVAVGVAAWQGRLQRQSLNQNMFDRRYSVYLGVRNFLSDYSINATADLNSSFNLLRETREAEWLFGPEIGSFIQEIYGKSIKLRTLENVQRQSQGTGQLLPVNTQGELEELSEWIAATAHTLAHQKFTPYLQLYIQPKGRVARLFRHFKRSPATSPVLPR